MKDVILSHPMLEEAKKRFPIGTKFYPAHLKHDMMNIVICTVTENDIFNVDSEIIRLSMGNYTKNGHDYIELIYSNVNGWAEIIGIPITKSEIINHYSIY